MRLTRSLSLIATLGLLVTAHPTNADAAGELPLRRSPLQPGQAVLGLGVTHLKNTSSFGDGGQREQLPHGGSLQSITGTFFGEICPLPDISVLLTADYVSTTLKSADPSSQQSVNNVSNAPGDMFVGARYWKNDAPIHLFLDAGVKFPLYKRFSASDWSRLSSDFSVPTGDGATSYNLFGTAELPLTPGFKAGVGVGYVARSAGFSNYLPYRTYVRHDEPQGLFAHVGFSGQTTLGEDRFTGSDEPERSRVAIGQSQLYNAMNPTLFRLDAMVGTYLGKSFFIDAGIQLPLSGKNIPAQPTYSLAAGFDFGGPKNTSDYVKSNRGFQQYTLAARVVGANNSLRQVLIDRGRNDGVKIREILDLFEPDTATGAFGETIARARVVEAGPTRSKLQIFETFKEARLQEGFVVRRPVR